MFYRYRLGRTRHVTTDMLNQIDNTQRLLLMYQLNRMEVDNAYSNPVQAHRENKTKTKLHLSTII